MTIINEFGTFESEIIETPEDRYNELILLSKTFWITDSCFSITTDTGEVFFPPEIISKSILKIDRVN
jgi:hypothetical protein